MSWTPDCAENRRRDCSAVVAGISKLRRNPSAAKRAAERQAVSQRMARRHRRNRRAGPYDRKTLMIGGWGCVESGRPRSSSPCKRRLSYRDEAVRWINYRNRTSPRNPSRRRRRVRRVGPAERARDAGARWSRRRDREVAITLLSARRSRAHRARQRRRTLARACGGKPRCRSVVTLRSKPWRPKSDLRSRSGSVYAG